MACKSDVRSAILDKVFEELTEGRYTFTRLDDNTIQVNSRGDNSKSRVANRQQARAIANELAKRTFTSFKGQVKGTVNEVSEYDPITISFEVNDAYVNYEFRKLNIPNKEEQEQEQEREYNIHDTGPNSHNQIMMFSPATETRETAGVYVKFINFKKSILNSSTTKLNKIKAAKRKQGVTTDQLKSLNKQERELELAIEGSYERGIKGLKDEIAELQKGASTEAVAYYVEKDLDTLSRLVQSNDIDDITEAQKIADFYTLAGTFNREIENPFFTQEEIFLANDDGSLSAEFRLDEDIMKVYREWAIQAGRFDNQLIEKKKELTTALVNSNPAVKKTYGDRVFNFNDLIYNEKGLKDTDWISMWTMDITSGLFSHNGILPQVIFSYLNGSIETKARWARDIEERIDKLNPKVQQELIKKGQTLNVGGIIGLTGASYQLFKEVSKEGNETNSIVQRFTKEFFDEQSKIYNAFQEAFSHAKTITDFATATKLFNRAFEGYKNWKRNNTIIVDVTRIPEIVSDSEVNLFGGTADDTHKKELVAILGQRGYDQQVEEQKKLLRKYISDRQNFIDTTLIMEGKSEGDTLSDEGKASLQYWEHNHSPTIGYQDYHSVSGVYFGGRKNNSFMNYNTFVPRKNKVTIRADRDTDKYVFTDSNVPTNNYSKQFAEIEENPILLEFYDIIKEVCDTIRDSVPYEIQQQIAVNTLPGLEKSTSEILGNKEMGLLRRIFSSNGAIAAMWERIRLGFGVVKQSEVSYAHIDPKTGRPNYTVNDGFLKSNNSAITDRQYIEGLKFTKAYNSNKPEDARLSRVRKYAILPLSSFSEGSLILLAQYTHTDLSLEDIKAGRIDALKAKVGDRVEIGRIIKDFSTHSVVQSQSFDLAKLAKYFSNLTMAYAARQEALPLLEIVKKHYQSIQQPDTTNIGNEIYNVKEDKYNKLGIRTQAIKQMDDWFERVALNNYGVKHAGVFGSEQEGALIGKTIYSKEDRKKLKEINYLLANTTDEKEVKRLESLKKGLGKIRTGTALVDNLLSWIRTLKLGYNLSSSVTNFLEGVTSNTILAASGEYFDSKELYYGYRVAKESSLKNITFGRVATNRAKKCRKLMDKFNVVMDSKNELQKSSHKTYASKLSWLNPLELNQRVEYLNQSPIMIAMLRTSKIKDKNENESSVWDAMTPDGTLKDEFRTPDNIENWEELAGNDYLNFKEKLNKVIVLGHGNYDELRGMMIKSNTAGKAVAMFKTWLPQQVYWRFASKQDDIETGTIGYRGRYWSYGKGTGLLHGAIVGTALFGPVGTAVFGALGLGLGWAKGTNTDINFLKETLYATKQLFLRTLGMPINLIAGKQLISNGENAFENWVGKGTFTKKDAANLRANMADISLQLMWIALMLGVKSIFWDDDDEPDSDSRIIHNIAVNKLVQLSSQAAMYVNPVEVYKSTIGTMGIEQFLVDCAKEVERIDRAVQGRDIIATGVNAGKSGLALQSRKLFMPGIFKDKYLGFETQSQRVFTESPLHRYFKSDAKLDEETNKGFRAARRAELEEVYKDMEEKERDKEIRKILDQELPTPTRLKKLQMTREQYEEQFQPVE